MATKKTSPEKSETKVKKATEKPAAAKTAKTTTTKTIITESEIRIKAEEIYNQRLISGEPGDQQSDWLKAEKALKGSNKK